MNPINRIQNNLRDFSRAELAVANKILENPSVVLQTNLTSLAKQSRSSTAAVIRMCQRICYDGYKEFKFSVSRYLISGPTDRLAESDEKAEDSLSYVTNAYMRFIALLRDTVSNDDIHRLAESIINAKRITIWGVNRTGFSATQLSYRLAQLGILSVVVTDVMIMNYYASIMGKEDLCILFSIRGKGNVDYKELMQSMRESGCEVDLITMTPKINMIKEATHSILLPNISGAQDLSFMDDQAINFVFIEALLHEVSSLLNTKNND